MEYQDELKKELHNKFSLNFLIANHKKLTNVKRDKKIMDQRITSTAFDTRNFQAKSYYKPISSIVNVNAFKKND
ncbi:MAG: hypothetical protein JJ975_08750 [Bacteroidia bacterium]|nr:hypothetical protein [Bacteroidia bacterium]